MSFPHVRSRSQHREQMAGGEGGRGELPHCGARASRWRGENVLETEVVGLHHSGSVLSATDHTPENGGGGKVWAVRIRPQLKQKQCGRINTCLHYVY